MESIFTLDDIFDDGTLNSFTDFVKDSANYRGHLTNFRYSCINARRKHEFSQVILDALKPFLPDNLARCGVSPYIYFCKSNKDHSLGIHTDTPSVKGAEFTVILYLNDSGGNVIFFDNDFKIIAEVEPKRNRTLIFDINLFHSTRLPDTEKFWIGTELTL